MLDKKTSFFNDLTAIFKTHIDEDTTIESIRHDFDSMARSEVIFLIEDNWEVDLWGVKLLEFKTFGDIIKHVESKL